MVTKTKIAKEVVQKPLGEAYKGTLSTFIVTLMILFVGFFLPMITSDRLENARRGENTWVADITKEEYLIWSIESDADFNSVEIRARSDDGYYNGKHQWGKASHITSSQGIEHLMASTWKNPNQDTDFNNYWLQRTRLPNSQHRYKMVYNEINYAYTDISFGGSDKVEGNYMVGNLIDDVPLGSVYHPSSQPCLHWSYNSLRDPHNGHRHSEQLNYWTRFDLDEWVDNEATTLKTYIEFEADYDYCRFIAEVYSQNTGSKRRIDSQVINVNPSSTIKISTVSDITLEDFIAIQTLVGGGDLCIRLRYYGVDSSGSEDYTKGMPKTDPQVIFDASVYGLLSIEEERPVQWVSSMTKYSIYMILESILIFAVGFVMLPQLSIGRLAEMLHLVEKKKI